MDDSRDRLVRKGDYIYGSFVRPELVDGYINGVNPGDRGDVLGRFAFSEASVDDAVEHARVASRIWRRVGLNDRSAAVRRFRQALTESRERVVTMVTRETGKPAWESRQEVVNALKTIDHLLDAGVGLLAPHVIDELPGRTDRIPRGVVAVVCPFSLPVRVTAVYTAAAILAGNTVVYKPSKFTPGVGQLMAEMWDQCRLPRGVLNMVQGSGGGVGKRLVTHQDIDALMVTGAFSTAMEIRRQVFDRPELPVLYQSGGKGIALVLDGCDLERATYEVMTGAFLSSGQRHDSTGRVMVCAGVYDAFMAMLLERTQQLSVGYGFDDDVFMGPLISENARSRFRRYGRALAKKGHSVLLEGKSITDTERRGFYVTPSIYGVDWTNGTPFLNEEPPGPTLLVYKAADVEEAVALHNQAHYRRACAVFPGDDTDLSMVVERLRTGAVMFNQATTSVTTPLASVGLGRSSNGLVAGLGLARFLTYPRAQVAETRPFKPTHVLPGVSWGSATPTVVELAPDDVSAMLEPEL